jgi:hypothetical protein
MIRNIYFLIGVRFIFLSHDGFEHQPHLIVQIQPDLGIVDSRHMFNRHIGQLVSIHIHKYIQSVEHGWRVSWAESPADSAL